MSYGASSTADKRQKWMQDTRTPRSEPLNILKYAGHPKKRAAEYIDLSLKQQDTRTEPEPLNISESRTLGHPSR